VLRVVRDTAQSKFVKELYNYRCQVCEKTIYAPRLKSLWYCEAHHLKPLEGNIGDLIIGAISSLYVPVTTV
jgi:predicted restriction endonuclease